MRLERRSPKLEMVSTERGVNSPRAASPFASSDNSWKCSSTVRSMPDSRRWKSRKETSSRSASSRWPWTARSAILSRRLVVLPIAETTTTGLRSSRDLTMPASRSMASADSTEVPPNFITIMRRARSCAGYRERPRSGAREVPSIWNWGSIQQALGIHELGIEDGGAGCAADGVVLERDEFVSKRGAFAHAADEGPHTVVAFGVASRLRAVLLGHVGDGLSGGAGKLALLWNTGEVSQRLDHFVQSRLPLQGKAGGDHVAVDHRDAIAVRAHFGGQRVDGVAAEVAQDFLRFLLHFLFFAADERDDVGVDVHGGDAGIACAGNGLHGSGDHGGDAELFQRRERHGQNHGGAIRVGYDHAFPAAFTLLERNDLEMIGIDFGDEQGHIGIHAVVFGVGYDNVACARESLLDLGGDRRIGGGENEAGRVAGLAFLDGERLHHRRHHAAQTPASSFTIGLAGRAVAGAEPSHFEPGMVLQKFHKMLADHSGRAQDSDFDFLPVHKSVPCVMSSVAV